MNKVCEGAGITPTTISAQLAKSDKRSGIYCIWMPGDEKHRVYVGQSANVGGRWNAHRTKLRNGTHHTRPLLNAYNKYGEAAWVWALVEECDTTDKVAITAAEQAWMDIVERDRLFNTSPAAGSCLGVKHSPETREKLRAAKLGKKRPPETIERMRAANIGKKMQPEIIEKLRAANTGRKRSPEFCEKLRVANIGRKHTPEAIERMRAAKAGTKPSSAHMEKLWAASTGRKQSPETIAKRITTRAANRAAQPQGKS